MFGPAGRISRLIREQGPGSFFDRKVVDGFFGTTPSTRRWAAGSWESPRRWASRSRCSGRGLTRPGSTSWPAGWRRRSRSRFWWAWSPSSAGTPLGAGRGRRGRISLWWRCLGSSPTRTWRRSTRSSVCSGPSPSLAGERALRSPLLSRAMAAAGALWSLALLTKIHAWFLLPILAVWAFCRLPPRRALSGHGRLGRSSGSALFWVGWPWLWYDSVRPGFRAYWGTGVARTTIMVAVFRQSVRRSRRALALSLVLLRGDRASGIAALGGLGSRPGLEEPPGRPVPVVAGRLDPGFLDRSSARGCRSTTANGCSCTSSRPGRS